MNLMKFNKKYSHISKIVVLLAAVFCLYWGLKIWNSQSTPEFSPKSDYNISKPEIKLTKKTFKESHFIGNILPHTPHNKNNTKVSKKPKKTPESDSHLMKITEARDLIDAGNPSAAKKILEEMLLQNPDDVSALTEMGLLELIDFNKPNSAKLYLERALRVDPSNKMVLSELVNIYEQTNSVAEGLALFKSLSYENNNSTDLSWAIGQTLMNLGNNEEAISYLEEATYDESQPFYILTDLADAYSASGMPEKALETYQRAIIREKAKFAEIENDTESRTAQRERLSFLEIDYAKELIKQNKLQEAEELLHEIKERSSENSETISAILSDIWKKNKKL